MSLQRENVWLWFAGLVSAFAVVSLLAGSRRNLATAAAEDRQVDLASEDSFPASDPPSWTATHTGSVP